MPKLTIEGHATTDAGEGQRLVNAIAEAGVDIGHRCGGQAKCTTCRVRFLEGEPEAMTRAEYEKLQSTNALGEYRLACQIVCDQAMAVEVLMRASEKGWSDPGSQPAEEVEPEAEWFTPEELAEERE